MKLLKLIFELFLGFIYGYDPRVCGSRDITAQVITGATFIDDINNAPNV